MLKETDDQQMPWQASSLTGDFYFNPGLGQRLTTQPISEPAAARKAEVMDEISKLYVKSEPKDAQIRILNIRPKFQQGIELKPGRYHIEASKNGYNSVRTWQTLDAGDIIRPGDTRIGGCRQSMS